MTGPAPILAVPVFFCSIIGVVVSWVTSVQMATSGLMRSAIMPAPLRPTSSCTELTTYSPKFGRLPDSWIRRATSATMKPPMRLSMARQTNLSSLSTKNSSG